MIIIEQESKSECFIEVHDQGFDSVGDKSKVEENDPKTKESISSQDSLKDFYDTLLDNNDTYFPSNYEDAESMLENRDADRTLSPVRVRNKPDQFGFSNLCAGTETYDHVGDLSLREALIGSEKEQWKMAINEEPLCFKDNDAWELSGAPQDGRVVQVSAT